MAVKKKYDRNVLGRGLDNIGTGKGRGLDALIDTGDVMVQGSSNLSEIALNMISPNPNQPRREFDESAMQELAASIREIGIITPVTLRQTGDHEYQIIAGERRWRAATIAGLTSIPAYIRTAPFGIHWHDPGADFCPRGKESHVDHQLHATTQTTRTNTDSTEKQGYRHGACPCTIGYRQSVDPAQALQGYPTEQLFRQEG